MKKIITAVLFFTIAGLQAQNPDSLALRKLYDYYLTQSHCYTNLEQLCTTIGNRISGSKQAEQAVQWAKKAMYDAGADTVILQPCMVPHWVRGKKEKCVLTSSKLKLNVPLNSLSLGSSIGTGAKGVKAKIVEVHSFEEMALKEKDFYKGKIIFYSTAFNQSYIRPMEAYRDAVKFRARGASHAAKYGAVACLVRSMSSVNDDEPHTGNMLYDTTISKIKIPALAISVKAAEALQSALQKDNSLEVYIENYCGNLPPVLSYNVVGQITGTEKPNEFIIAGGHLDSWDVGQGAHDDGCGVVQSIELLAAYKKLGIRPKHSIRAVAFMNEENGTAGGNAYAKFATEKKEKHLLALETDAGGYAPRGFNVDTLNGMYRMAASWQKLFVPYFAERMEQEGGGADISALEKTGVPCIGFEPENQRYFDIHHTAQDTFDKVNKRELELSAAAIGAILYLFDAHL